jgi:hypothetical protein
MNHEPDGIHNGLVWRFSGAVLLRGYSTRGLSDIAVAVQEHLNVGILTRFTYQIHPNDAARDRGRWGDACQEEVGPVQRNSLSF